jgi:hypothetical protein
VSGDIMGVVRAGSSDFWWLKFGILAIRKRAPSNMIK